MTFSRIPKIANIFSGVIFLQLVLFTSYAAAASNPGYYELEEITTGNSFYVSPTGSPNNDGSINRPCDIATALSHPETLKPGDTIWLRGGTYRGVVTSYLQGTQNYPITVRSFPGEWAVIDTVRQQGDPSGFHVYSAYTYYWDFEITNTNNQNRGGENIETETCNK